MLTKLSFYNIWTGHTNFIVELEKYRKRTVTRLAGLLSGHSSVHGNWILILCSNLNRNRTRYKAISPPCRGQQNHWHDLIRTRFAQDVEIIIVSGLWPHTHTWVCWTHSPRKDNPFAIHHLIINDDWFTHIYAVELFCHALLIFLRRRLFSNGILLFSLKSTLDRLLLYDIGCTTASHYGTSLTHSLSVLSGNQQYPPRMHYVEVPLLQHFKLGHHQALGHRTRVFHDGKAASCRQQRRRLHYKDLVYNAIDFPLRDFPDVLWHRFTMQRTHTSTDKQGEQSTIKG